MKTNTLVTSWRSARVVTASVLASMMLASGSAASASGDSTTFVSGNITYSDCGRVGSDLALLMTGDLEGCLSIYVEGSSCKELDDYDLYLERGREVFVGKLRGKQGRFGTTYLIDAAMAKGFCQSFDFSLEVGGSGNHIVQGRSGVFEGAKGEFKCLDVNTNVMGDPVTGEFTAGTGANNFLYYGHIQLD